MTIRLILSHTRSFLFNRIRELKGPLESILRQFAQSLYDCVIKHSLLATHSHLDEAPCSLTHPTYSKSCYLLI